MCFPLSSLIKFRHSVDKVPDELCNARVHDNIRLHKYAIELILHIGYATTMQ